MVKEGEGGRRREIEGMGVMRGGESDSPSIQDDATRVGAGPTATGQAPWKCFFFRFPLSLIVFLSQKHQRELEKNFEKLEKKIPDLTNVVVSSKQCPSDFFFFF